MFKMLKGGRSVQVKPPSSRDFRPSQAYAPIDPARVIGVDTESFRWNGALTTVMIPAHTSERPVMLEFEPGQSPIVSMFDWLMADFGQDEDRPSRTKQRSKETRKERTGRADGRDGRRESVEPLVLVWYNAEYDLGRLLEKELPILRAIAVGQDSYTVPIGPYTLEVAHMNPTGSAPSFDWYVRHPDTKRIVRLLGRDMWGYWKQGLDKTAKALVDMGVTAKIKVGPDLFSKDWTEITEEEKAELRVYALQDSKTTREIYLATVELLTQIDPRVLKQDGTIPASAPGAAAKIAFQMAFDDGLERWLRPPAWACQMGLNAYAGGRVFCRKPGPAEGVMVRDITSAYPDAMTLVPDPARCKYRRIRKGPFLLEKWKGSWGVMTIKGEGLDPDFPALRTHDERHGGRLRYVVGKFQRLTATIPEIVIGVASGRLRVDRILDGVIMEGPTESSFLRRYILKVFGIKENAERDSPLYLIAKLLMNSPYGKLIEVRELNRSPVGADGYYLLPRWTELQDQGFRDYVRSVYVENGIDGLEELRQELIDHPVEAKGAPEIMLREVLAGTEYTAGHYFLPLHAAQVTGFVAAKLGLAAWATDSLQGDTDSIFTLRQDMGEYYNLMSLAGYPAPEKGLGSFGVDIANVSGVLVKPKMYSLVSSGGKWKQAHHGIIRLMTPADKNPKEHLHELMVALVEDGRADYETKSRPVRFRTAVRRGLIPGEFYSEARKIALTLDPNLRRDPDGYLRWKSEEELQDEIDAEVLAWERNQEVKNRKAWCMDFRRAWLRRIGRIKSTDHDRDDIPRWCRAGKNARRARSLDELLPGGGAENPLDDLGEFSPGWITEAELLDLLVEVSP